RAARLSSSSVRRLGTSRCASGAAAAPGCAALPTGAALAAHAALAALAAHPTLAGRTAAAARASGSSGARWLVGIGQAQIAVGKAGPGRLGGDRRGRADGQA